MTSYLDGLSAYSYLMPCGHSFRSLTRSEPDDDGMHWFYCRQCKGWAAMSDSAVTEHETPPLHPSGMRMSDNQLVVRINAAILKDRIAAYYRVHWDSVTIRHVAAELGVAVRHVQSVAMEMGVYGPE